MGKIGLEQFWKDEDINGWKKYVQLCEQFWNGKDYQLDLLKELKYEYEIAVVVNHNLGKSALIWIYNSIPALENLKPIECLENESLKVRLKMCLWRMD